jgi:beta-1,4-mannosyl-glycoprotein beta-1,4-N-acetylglucosaminyltransferase
MKGIKNIHKKHSMIIDGIIFFNELDLLEIRLNFLNNYIDYFVIVESKKTFQGHTKPLYYLENKARFESFNSKIIHVVLDDFPDKTNAWKNESLQRDSMLKGLQQFSDEDYILISDVDEIPNLESLPSKLKDNFFYIFELSLNYYYLNNRCIQIPNLFGTILTKYKNIKGSIQEIRDLLNKVHNKISSGKNIEIVKNGGWHFSYLTSPENIALKIKNFSHSEFNNEKYTNLKTIQNHIKNNEDLFDRGLDFAVTPISQLPSYVKKNIKKYIKKGFIKQNDNNLFLDESDF